MTQTTSVMLMSVTQAPVPRISSFSLYYFPMSSLLNALFELYYSVKVFSFKLT